MVENRFMRRAIELSRASIEKPGTRPYAAVVIKDGRIVGEGLNQAEAKLDPTSHGEIEAIRDACRNLGTTDLSDCELYTSCEPCILCTAAMYRVGIIRLFYGAALADDAALIAEVTRNENGTRRWMENDEIKREATKPWGEGTMPATQLMADEAYSVLLEWRARQRAAAGEKA